MEVIKKCISENKVYMFSKTYCPYCDKAKNALDSIGVKYGLMELDMYKIIELYNRIPEGRKIQDALAEMTGRRTVPNVFINGKTIGGGIILL